MLLLVLVLFVHSCDALYIELCKGANTELQTGRNVLKTGKLVFLSSYGQSRILMIKGKATNPRITVLSNKVRLIGLQKEDEGKYQFISLRGLENQYEVKVIECFTIKYMDNFQHNVPERAQYLYFKDRNGNEKFLWDRAQGHTINKRREIINNNVWTMVDVTQEAGGVYFFTRKDMTVELKIKLSIKEETQDYKVQVNESLFIKFPERGGPWNVVFSSKNKQQRVMIKNQLVLERTGFEGRITIQSNSIEIKSVKAEDSGTFNFRDQQGNLAMSVKLDVDSGPNPLVAYIVVPLVLLAVCGLCWSFCSKKDKSKPSEQASVSPNPDTVHASQPNTNMYPLVHQVPIPDYSTTIYESESDSDATQDVISNILKLSQVIQSSV